MGTNGLDYRAMGERVRQRRQALKLTQSDLARGVGVSTSFIGHIERGEKKASAETVVALCRELATTADWLLLGLQNRCDQQQCGLYEEFRKMVRRYGEML